MTHDPATTWCGGRGVGGQCHRRHDCVHYTAFMDHGTAHPGTDVPPEITVAWRLCGPGHEHHRPREAAP